MGIRFENIRQDHNGPNFGFEEMVCQIARRTPPDNATEFRRIEGAGGDGGVEAYWITNDRRKIGYQAKYFLKVGNIDWRQIDESVRQALKTHPELSEYRIALACDLTGKSGAKGRGKSGWEHWDTWKARWNAHAKSEGLAVNFVPVTADEIVDVLGEPEFTGLRAYWFDEPFVGLDWFTRKFEETCADLDERFHPEDHVELQLGNVFDALMRNPAFWEELCSKVEQGLQIKELQDRCKRLKDDTIDAAVGALDVLPRAMSELSELRTHSISSDLSFSRLTEIIQSAIKSNEALKSSIRRILDASDSRESSEHRLISDAYDATYSWESSADDVLRWLNGSDYIQCDKRRALLIDGEAGIGKSHLIADAVSRSLDAQCPSIMFLGQHIGDDLDQSVLGLLGLGPYSLETALQALDCAAEVSRQHCVIAIDAINEAPDLRVWRNRLGSFLTKILRHPNLAVVLSCRPEYLKAVLPSSVADRIVKVTHRGFTSAEEQEQAAIQYIEKRGIARPAVPWLNPEFTNPLFLRTCTTAMKEAGLTAFPRGLRGSSKILSFYLDQLENRLIALFPDEDFSTGFIRRLTTSAVKLMTSGEKDWMSRLESEQLIQEVFSGDTTASQKSWLRTICSEGLLRRDHVFEYSDDGQLSESDEIYRFSFQRFFDLLAVSQVLSECDSAGDVFGPKSPFHSLVDVSNWHESGQRYLGALAIGIPEKFSGLELHDSLSAAGADVERSYLVRDAFKQSIRWRDTEAFSDRTFDIFNSLPDQYEDPRLAILVELSIVEDHPLNAECLHRFLAEFAMPERDSEWSIALAFATNDEQNELWLAVNRLIDWCLNADKSNASSKVLELASITLCWFFSTTGRTIRDRSTKALIEVLLERPCVARELVRKFSNIDDLYVQERVYAAIYGAACLGIPADEHKSICAEVWNQIFSENRPPLNMMLRDYALGILEKAVADKCLPSGTDIEVARPPYSSHWPSTKITDDELRTIADSAGDKAIYFSAGGMGDFARYEIEPTFRQFSNVPLSEPRPLSIDERKAKFEEIVSDWDTEKTLAFRKLEEQYDEYNQTLLNLRLHSARARIGDVADDEQPMPDAAPVEEALDAFSSMLSDEELSTFMKFGGPTLINGTDNRIPGFDTEVARKWITKRAYGFGWTSDLFPNEPADYNDRQRPRIERVGKKYQWLAHSELLATCADHFWMSGEWSGNAKAYSNSCDIDFVRDVDPTIVPTELDDGSKAPAWWQSFSITYEDANDQEVVRWTFSDENIPNAQDAVKVSAPCGEPWLVLKSFYSHDERHDRDFVSMPFRRSAFCRVGSFIVRVEEATEVIQNMAKRSFVDPTDWEHVDVTDGPFFREFLWRETWRDQFAEFANEQIRSMPDLEIARPVMEYHWESHLDASMPNGARTAMPSTWLATELSLVPSGARFGEFVNRDGELVFFDPSATRASSEVGLVKEKDFLEALAAKGLQCIWVVAGEKNSCPSATRETFGERQYTKIVTVKGGKWTSTDFYFDDHRKGLSQYDATLTDKLRF